MLKAQEPWTRGYLGEDPDILFYSDPPPLKIATAADPYLQPVAYVSGPYRDPKGTFWVERNIREAEAVAVELWRMGFATICPHTNTKHMDGAFPSSSEVFIRGDLELVRRSDVVVMLPRWFRSAGAMQEYVAAAAADIPCLFWGNQLHKTYLTEIGLDGRDGIERVRRLITRSN